MQSSTMAFLSPPFTFISILFFCFLTFSLSLSSPSQPHHFLTPKKLSNETDQSDFQESIELTQPLPTSQLPYPPPECTLSLLNFTFNDTMGRPPVTVDYSPPADCPAPWSYAVLHLSGAVSGEQYDRVAAIWLAGAEILRTTTPEPFGNGTFWNVQKDITRYSALLQQSNITLSVMLENLVNDQLTGAYDVNLTILFYKETEIGAGIRKLGLGLSSGLGGFEGNGLYDEPADLVIPVGDEEYDGHDGYWFRIEDGSTVGSKNVMIPMNARKVVLELYVSSHGDDEFWYSNPPDSYILANNLTTTRGNGAFREVFVRIDGGVVACEVPFPVVYTGGINPLFWEPVVGIGAFNLPSYDFDLTTSLGTLLDGNVHSIEIGVSNAIRYWLVDANLHVWLDKDSSTGVRASAGVVKPTEYEESFDFDFKQLDGKFEIEVERKSYSLGWVASSYGNFTTSVEKKLKFKSKIKFKNNGSYKTVDQKVKVKTKVKVLTESGSTISESSYKRTYPLTLIISTLPGSEIGSNLMVTNISRELKEEFSNGQFSGSVSNIQNAGGWVLVKDHSVLTGVAETQHNLSYQGKSGCYSRSVKASRGKLVLDEIANTCTSFFHTMVSFLFSNW